MPDPGLILLEPGGLVTIGADRVVSPAPASGPQPTCCDCQTATTLYAQACPCGEVYAGGEPPNDCRAIDTTAPGGACIYVDLRSLLADDTAHPLGLRLFSFWSANAYVGPTIKVGEFCYRFSQPTALFAPPTSTPEQRAAAVLALTPPGAIEPGAVVDLPAGVQTAGGDRVVIATVTGCGPDAGCAPVPLGGDYREAVPCDGGPGNRVFVCARLASRGTTFACRCIVRSRTHTAAEVAAIQATDPNVLVIDSEPPWDMVWAYGPQHPVRVPAGSCCFCLSAFTGSNATCLSGRKWSNVWGARRWATTDLCCGRLDGFRYDVVLGYTRVIRTPHPDGSMITTTITARVDRVVRRSSVVFAVEGTVTTVGTRTDGGGTTQTYFGESPLEILLNPTCCLYPAFDHRMVPTVGYLAQDGTTFTEGGAEWPWSQVVPFPAEPFVPDAAGQLRSAWQTTPWSVPLQLVSTANGGAYSGSGTVFGDCRAVNFRLTESVINPNGSSDSVSINLKVTAVYDNAAPCGYLGRCTSTGWRSRDITELVP